MYFIVCHINNLYVKDECMLPSVIDQPQSVNRTSTRTLRGFIIQVEGILAVTIIGIQVICWWE